MDLVGIEAIIPKPFEKQLLAHVIASEAKQSTVVFLSNHSGGIQGGITNGEEVYFNVAFKPIPTLGRGNRHDVCALPRATVIVEAMAALTTIKVL